jgi:uncharacterized LabA/DUF88 family protein
MHMPLFKSRETEYSDQSGVYIFVDGAYLEKAYASVMGKIFNDPGELDYAEFQATTNHFRVFYYAATESKLDSETEDQFNLRFEMQQGRFETIGGLPGFHVRTGVTTGGKKRTRRQKEVDVQLAVDMLTYGARGSLRHVKLIAGDRDFRPLVEATVALGVHVEVAYEKDSGAKELYRAADVATRLTPSHFHFWSSESFRQRFQPPQASRDLAVNHRASYTQVGVGKVAERYDLSVEISPNGTFQFKMTQSGNPSILFVGHRNPEIAERYVAYEYGAVEWSRKDPPLVS